MYGETERLAKAGHRCKVRQKKTGKAGHKCMVRQKETGKGRTQV